MAPRVARRTHACRARPALRRLARPQPPTVHRAAARLSLRARCCGADCTIAAESRVQRSAGGCAPQRAPLAARNADGIGRARGAAFSCARRSPPARNRAPGSDPRRTVRRTRGRDSRHDAVPPAGKAEPSPGNPPRSRPCARLVARRFPHRGRRHRHPGPPLPAGLRPADAAAVSRLLPGRPDRPRPAVARSRGGGGCRGRARD